MHAPGALVNDPASDGDDRTRASSGGLWRSALRWVRDAAIGLALLTIVPLAALGVADDPLTGLRVPDLGARLAQVEPVRALRLPTSTELTPLEAGQLLHAMATTEQELSFPTHPVAPLVERPWEHAKPGDDLFLGITRAQGQLIQPAALLRAATGELSDAERTYLRTVAEAPYWRDFDRLASASSVDMLAGRFVLPFGEDASPLLMPIPRFAGTKALAYAGVARAAHHLSRGEVARAEHALRAVVSFGFVLLDNGSMVIDGLIGRVIVGIGRDGLHTLYTITGNADGAAMTAPLTDAPAAARRAIEPLTEAQQIAIARDPSLPRTMRMESLFTLGFRSCSSVRGVLFGPSAAVEAAFDEARQTLARYPSERALLDLWQDAPNRPLPVEASGVPPVLVGAVTVASTVLQNPRLQTCALLRGIGR